MKTELRASELRIGNLVLNPPFGGVRIVDVLDIRDLAEGRLIVPFEPIILTKEWLIKCGFVNEGGIGAPYCKLLELGWSVESKYILIRTLANGVDFSISLVDSDIDQDFEIVDSKYTIMKHVHQLQNLYYSLTGKELIPNKKTQ